MNKLTHATELALIQVMYDKEKPALKNGKLKNKYLQLKKIANKELDKIKIKSSDVPKMYNALDIFAKRSGWDSRERDIKTFVSFNLAMIDSSENKFPEKITELLGEIYDYYDRKKKVPELCGIGGLNSADIWEDVKRECF